MLVVSLVVVLVLLVGGGLTTWLLLRRGSDDAATADAAATAAATAASSDEDGWSEAWLNGFQQVWTQDAPSGTAASGSSVISIRGDKLVRMTENDDSVVVTVFSLGDDGPVPLWEESADGVGTQWIVVWDNRIVLGSTLVDIDSQAHTTAPWAQGAVVKILGGNAIACDGRTCSMWTSLTEKKWDTEIPTSKERVRAGKKVDHYALVTAGKSGEESFLIDLDNGGLKEMSAGTVVPLADGWLSYPSHRRGESGKITLYKADGSIESSFDEKVPENFTTYPWSPDEFTLEQACKWFGEGDASWAPATYSVSPTDASCESISVNGNDIKLGKDNSIAHRGDEGCQGTSQIQAVYHSGKGRIATFYENQRDETVLHLVDMTTGTPADPLSLGDYRQYAVAGDRLVVLHDDGSMVGYRPA